MAKNIRNIDWPFCISFDSNGYAYCSDKRHYSGLFYRYELEKIKESVIKTLIEYDIQGITDEYIDLKDNEAIEREFSQFRKSKKVEREKIIDDLYLIHDTNSNLLKIGRSKNVKKRLKQLQSANGNKLVLICEIKGGGDNEMWLHEKYNDLRKEGEWFEFSESILDEFLLLGGNINNYKEKKEKIEKENNELFEQCWIAYNRKGSKKKSKEYWHKLTEKEREQVFQHIKVYVNTREKKFQKDFERYLRDKTFNDLIIQGNNVVFDPSKEKDNTYHPITGGALMWNDYYKCYLYTGWYFDGDGIADGYDDDKRPDGAQIVLNNGRGTLTWNKEQQKWVKS